MGALALVRSDVSDTLPGVAIAISLVAPLAVIGLTLESGAVSQAVGALLLFATNVAAIVATGTLLLLGYRIRDAAIAAGRPVGRIGLRSVAVVVGLVVLVSVPLGLGSYRVVSESATIAGMRPVAERWGLLFLAGWVSALAVVGVRARSAAQRAESEEPRTRYARAETDRTHPWRRRDAARVTLSCEASGPAMDRPTSGRSRT